MFSVIHQIFTNFLRHKLRDLLEYHREYYQIIEKITDCEDDLETFRIMQTCDRLDFAQLMYLFKDIGDDYVFCFERVDFDGREIFLNVYYPYYYQFPWRTVKVNRKRITIVEGNSTLHIPINFRRKIVKKLFSSQYTFVFQKDRLIEKIIDIIRRNTIQTPIDLKYIHQILALDHEYKFAMIPCDVPVFFDKFLIIKVEFLETCFEISYNIGQYTLGARLDFNQSERMFGKVLIDAIRNWNHEKRTFFVYLVS